MRISTLPLVNGASIYGYCVTEFETFFCGLVYWRFFILPPLAPNKNICQLYVFYSKREDREY